MHSETNKKGMKKIDWYLIILVANIFLATIGIGAIVVDCCYEMFTDEALLSREAFKVFGLMGGLGAFVLTLCNCIEDKTIKEEDEICGEEKE